jgi:hypothetical protein
MQGQKTCARRQEKQASDRARWGVFNISHIPNRFDTFKNDNQSFQRSFPTQEQDILVG